MGVHDGHRKRRIAAFRANGMDNMAHHEILEMLLFYAIPRRDTNEIAHRLVDEFGGLRGVFEAPYEELLKIDGIGENAATFLKMFPEVSRAYALDVHKPKKITSAAEAADYFIPKFIGRTKEIVFLASLDNKNCVISCDIIAEGSVRHAFFSTRKVIELAVKHNATSVVIAHNHPNGRPIPSDNDFDTTRELVKMCRMMHISLLDHVVVAGNDYYSMAQNGTLSRMMTGI